MSWKLLLLADLDHLDVWKIDAMNGQVKFSLESFYQDLLAICRDPQSIVGFAPNEVSDRYNQWTVKTLDATNGTQEQKKTAQQIEGLLP
jgi:hypothetical protein